MEEMIGQINFDEFDPPNIEIQRNYWQDDDIWGIMKSYPLEIQQGFEKLKEVVHLYISNGFGDQLQKQHPFNEAFLRDFCHLLVQSEQVEPSFAQAGGIRYKFGLEWAKLKILHFYKKFSKNPATNYGFYYYFRRDIKKGLLKKYNILCWKDLLDQSLEEQTYYEGDRQNLAGNKGLERAKIYLKKQHMKNGKIPRSKDLGFKLIANAIRRNVWRDFGITTWGDLIFETFGYVKGTKNLWKGEGGFLRAISWIKKYENNYGTFPTIKNNSFASIKSSIARGYWKKDGIKYWSDLINQVVKN